VRAIRDSDDKLVSIELERIEMKELLAFEATCACLIPKSRRAFLEATMRNYNIAPEKMMPLIEKGVLSREDVWKLQVLKRNASDDSEALGAIARLRRMEAELGRDVLQTYVDRRKITPGT
jgi:hypothetical protein